jgi:hypothetical protein
MSLDEKRYANEKVLEREGSFDAFDNSQDLNDDLREPTKAEETLHRGLKARQISMIAVRSSRLVGKGRFAHPRVAGWCSRYWPYHRFWYRFEAWWPSR